MNECKQCGGAGEFITERLASFDAPESLLGIGGVQVCDAVEISKCMHCGAVNRTSIPDISELIAAVAVWRIMLPIKLNGKEIRFLRNAAGWQGKRLAKELDVSAETVSRWEHDEMMAPANEKVLRSTLGARLCHEAPGINFDQNWINSMKILGPRGTSVDIPMSFIRVLITPKKEAWNPRKAA